LIADAHDLFRIGNDRQEAQACELLIRLRALCRTAQLVERAGCDHVAQGRVAATEAIVHGGDAIADDHAEGRLAVWRHSLRASWTHPQQWRIVTASANGDSKRE